MNRERTQSEILKKGYSDEEVLCIFELGRLYIEIGEFVKAEEIFLGLIEIAPQYTPAWLGISYIEVSRKKYESAIKYLIQALSLNKDSIEVQIFLIVCTLSTKDFQSAGTYLGEVQEKIESFGVQDINYKNLYKSQLARFQANTALESID